MTFQYTTEYRLGRRGRVCRTYIGLQALIAIAFDLALGLVFGLVGLGIWAVRWFIVAAYRVARWCVMAASGTALALLRLPRRAIRAVSVSYSGRGAAKPAWATFDEF